MYSTHRSLTAVHTILLINDDLCKGNLRVTVGHPRETIGHLRATMAHLRLTIGYLKATVVHIRVALGHLKVTIGYFFYQQR